MVLNEIYLDYAATSPLNREAYEAMQPYFQDQYGNPNSPHQKGTEANRALVFAREKVARLLGVQPKQIIFTSGGAEANNQAILTAASLGKKAGKTELVTSAFEHETVLETMAFLEEMGFTVHYVKPNPNGLIELGEIEKVCDEKTALLSIMTVNNELGTVQDIEGFARFAKSKDVQFHTDAVQAVGHLPLEMGNEIDFLTLSAHKFGGPKGVGALLYQPTIDLLPLIHGGSQERGKRAGTTPVANIVGMAHALDYSISHLEENQAKWEKLSHILIEGVLEIPGAQLTGRVEDKLPSINHFTFEGVHQDLLLYHLNQRGIYASAGSACSAGVNEVSHVLSSMGMDEKRMKGALRFSFGPETTEEEVLHTIEVLKEVVTSLRKDKA